MRIDLCRKLTEMHTKTQSRHTFATRLAHAGLALAVILQLATSLFMQVPRGDRPADFAFELHQVFGVTALVFALAFWITITFRLIGTDAGALFPWASATRLSALKQDLARSWAAIRSRRLPPYDPMAPLAAAIHGLGLLLTSYMALSGTMYLIAPQVGYEGSGLLHLIMDVHGAFGNIVWAYLIGHAGMAALHHVTDHLDVREMWSLARYADGRDDAK